ncbi:glycine-rich cell wall structural protein 2 [Drosophila santomea]|uniref:glycine-rich cell wall structural protein 2 n=1 Tax=Drosophila santomea TaxID=129105 RepID=UPI001CCBC91B|nr:glycine-rich cell wall structural protein 2 [Drosophila santomea]
MAGGVATTAPISGNNSDNNGNISNISNICNARHSPMKQQHLDNSNSQIIYTQPKMHHKPLDLSFDQNLKSNKLNFQNEGKKSHSAKDLQALTSFMASIKVFVCLLASLALVNAGGLRGGAGGAGGGYLPGGGRGGGRPAIGAGLVSHVSQSQGNTKVHIGGGSAGGAGGYVGGAAAYGGGAGAAYGGGAGASYGGGAAAYGGGRGAAGGWQGGAGGAGGAGGWQGGAGGAGAGNAWGNPAEFDYTVNHASGGAGGAGGAYGGAAGARGGAGWWND